MDNVTLPEAAGSHTLSLELYSSDGCSGTKTPASSTFTTKTPTTNPDLAKKCDLKVALVLAAMTALETSTYWWNYGHFFMPVLLILMIAKFFTVVSLFLPLISLMQNIGQSN